MSWNGWDTNPLYFKPLSGKEVKEDGTVLDVPAWREKIQAFEQEKTQVRGGQDHLRVFAPENNRILFQILEELKTMNTHLSLITGEENV